MTHPINHFEDRAKTIRLTDAEKNAMRGRLAAFMQAHPLPAAVPTPYLSYLRVFVQPAFLSALLIIAITGSGTAFAAEDALPGDTLYPVKVNVVEPVRGALAVTPAAKAEWNVHLTDERLSEAQKLAATNRLSKEIQRSLGTRLAVTATEAARQVTDLASTSPKSAVAVAVTLDATLSAHQAAIRALADDENADEDSGPALAALRGNVDATVSDTAETLAIHPAMALSVPEEPVMAQGIARIQLFAADDVAEQAKGAFKAAAPMLKATTSEAASTTLQAADITLKKGKRAYDKKAYTDAALLFARARALARDSEHLIHASTTVEVHGTEHGESSEESD